MNLRLRLTIRDGLAGFDLIQGHADIAEKLYRLGRIRAELSGELDISL